MPGRGAHLRAANENRAFARLLRESGVTDQATLRWGITAAYYAGMHYLEAHFARHGKHGVGHPHRALLLHSEPTRVPPRVGAAYRRLKDQSEAVRYDLDAVNLSDLIDALDRDLTVITREAGDT